jgi:hypothetical protein
MIGKIGEKEITMMTMTTRTETEISTSFNIDIDIKKNMIAKIGNEMTNTK